MGQSQLCDVQNLAALDRLALTICFALTHEAIGHEAKKIMHSLSDHQIEVLCQQVAEHRRLCGWWQLPPELLATSDQFQRRRARGSAGYC
jgi:hypothetical protein